MMTTQLTFGEHIRRLRRDKKWNLQRLSEATGLSYTHLSRVENDSAKPKVDTVVRICEALDGDLTEMLELADSLPGEILDRMRQRQEQDSPSLPRSAGPRRRRPKGEALALVRAAGVSEEETSDLAEALVELLELHPERRELVKGLIRSIRQTEDDGKG